MELTKNEKKKLTKYIIYAIGIAVLLVTVWFLCFYEPTARDNSDVSRGFQRTADDIESVERSIDISKDATDRIEQSIGKCEDGVRAVEQRNNNAERAISSAERSNSDATDSINRSLELIDHCQEILGRYEE